MNTSSIISFGLDFVGHTVARWEFCQPQTVNLLTVGFGEGVGQFEFIDQNDLIWGVCVQWPDTIEPRDILAFGYRLERTLRKGRAIRSYITVTHALNACLQYSGAHFDIVEVSPDFEWKVS